MAVQFVPLERLTRRRRWEFVEPLHVVSLDRVNQLLVHPPSGSWAILKSADLPAFALLQESAKRGRLDELGVDDDNPLLVKLMQGGLLLKNGRTAWSDVGFDHSANSLNTLILKLVGYCNLACTYCYDYNQVTYRNRMSPALARQAISQSLGRANGELSILFHGGEPLLEPDLLRQLVRFARDEAESLGKDVSFSVQTNGTRFTREVVDFLIAEDFNVGVSLDGPAEINDALRIDHAGRGHHEKIETALREYPELAARVGILTTVTSRNVDTLVDVARYVRELGVPRWDITLFEASGRGSDDPDQYHPDTVRLIHSYLALFNAIDNGEFDELEIRPVLKYVRNALSYKRSSMCLRDGCGAAADLVSIRVDGTIEACDCIKHPDMDLGSLDNSNLAEALSSPTAKAIRGRTTEGLLDCQNCCWRVMCGGTCQAKAGLNSVDEQQCQLSLALFPEIFRRLAKSDQLLRYVRLFS